MYLTKARIMLSCFLVVSVLLPYLRITYYGEQTLQYTWWFTSLSYRSETLAGALYSAEWNLPWFAITGFASPFVFMFLGMKKRYTFDVGAAIFSLFLGWGVLPPLTSPMSLGAGWDSITSEAMIGSYVAAISLAVYGAVRLYLHGETDSLQVDRFSPPEDVKPTEFLTRLIIVVLSFLSFVLPFAVEYDIHHYATETEVVLSTVYHWFGGVGESNMPLWFVLVYPIIYLPLIMMWFGMKRARLFNNGVKLLTIYWTWHLLFFIKPFYTAEPGLYEHIATPTVGIVFFPIITLLYILSNVIARRKIDRKQKIKVQSKRQDITVFMGNVSKKWE